MGIALLFLRKTEDQDSSKTALVLIGAKGGKKIYSWDEYRKQAIFMAMWLRYHGVGKGDFVAVIPLNLPESFFVLMGIMLTGAVPVPINAPLVKERNHADLNKILDDCKPKFILASERLVPHLAEIQDVVAIEKILRLANAKTSNHHIGAMADIIRSERREDKEDDLLIMPYTSGTTSHPKGAMLSNKNILDRIQAVTQELGASENERILSYLSLGHISDLIATFFGQIHSGYTVYFTELAKEAVDNREKLKERFASILSTIKPTIFLAVPKVWLNLKNEIEKKTKHLPLPERFKSWLVKRRLGFGETKIFISAGSKLEDSTRQFFKHLDIDILDIYGQTETGGPLTVNGKLIGRNTWLLPIPNTDNWEEEFSAKEITAEIAVAGDNVMLGYYNNPEANDKVFGEKWEMKEKNGIKTYKIFRTGDIGLWHLKREDKRTFYAGRIGTGLKLAQGEFVTEAQVEMLEGKIKEIPGVEEAIVCGDGKPYLIALIFSHAYDPLLNERVFRRLPEIGQGLLTIRKFVILGGVEIELTPTLKLKREKIIKKFEHMIQNL